MILKYSVKSESIYEGGDTCQMYVFNECYLNCSPTNNGSGCNSVLSKYDDGFNGYLYDKIISEKIVIKKTHLIIDKCESKFFPTFSLVDFSEIKRKDISLSNGVKRMKGSIVFTYNNKYLLNSFKQLHFTLPVGSTATLTLFSK